MARFSVPCESRKTKRAAAGFFVCCAHGVLHFGFLALLFFDFKVFFWTTRKSRFWSTPNSELRHHDFGEASLGLVLAPLLGATMFKLLPSHRIGQGNRRFCMLDCMVVETLLAKYHLKAVSIDLCRTSSLQWTEH